MKKTLIFIFSLVLISGTSFAKSIKTQISEDGLNVKVDFSAIVGKTLVDQQICEFDYTPTKLNKSGVPVKMLGFAHVYMGAGPGSSIHGHIGERFIYCIGPKLYDVYFDGVVIDKKSMDFFRIDYNGADSMYMNSQSVMGGMYYRKIVNPTQISLYGMDTVQANRNIYEQWLGISEEEIYSLLKKNITRKKKQDEVVAHQGEFQRFRGLLNNCTYEVVDDLKQIETLKNIKITYKKKNFKSPGYKTLTKSLTSLMNTVQPKYVYKALAKSKAVKFLNIYPSQDNMRKIFFNKLASKEAVEVLEIPRFKFRPKYSVDWSQPEIEALTEGLADYTSPLIDFLNDQVRN